MEKAEIKNLLFDLGGVIMNLTRENCVRAFAEMGVKDADALFGEYAQQGAFLALEEGRINEAEFHVEVRKLIPGDVTDSQIDCAFNRFLAGIPAERLQALDALRERYKIYLLSNTNPIMINSDIHRYFRVAGKEMEDYFDGMVLSYEAKAAKPDLKIFEYAIKHLDIKPEETLFLDDSQKNLDSAARLGFETLLVSPGTEFIDLLKEKL